MRFLVRGRAEAQGSCSKAMLVSTGWHREKIKCSAEEILTASMHVEVRIIYHQQHRAVVLWNGHLSSSPARSYMASFQSCQQLPLSLPLQKFGVWQAFPYSSFYCFFGCIWKNLLLSYCGKFPVCGDGETHQSCGLGWTASANPP